MKVVAQFQFYLPYFLPRTAAWSEPPYLQHKFDVEGQLVHVHPRKANEELFPSPIDKMLGESRIKVESNFIMPVGAPDEIFVRHRCFDRIEAQVFGDVASKDDCLDHELAFAYRRSAISACNKFLYHCRVAGGDPEVEGLIWYYNFEQDRCYFALPHSLAWFDFKTKELLRDDDGKAFWTAAGAFRSPVRMPVELGKIQRSLTFDDQPDLPQGLLVSAKKCLMLEQLHEGMVNLGSACEIASTRYINRKGLSGSAQIRDILKRKVSFAEKRYNQLTIQLSGRSFKAEDVNSFSLLENAYRTRNNVAHSGELVYKDLRLGKTIAVTRSIVNDFYRGCERAVEWIEAL